MREAQGSLEQWKKAVQPNTKTFLLESPTNPVLEVLDIRADQIDPPPSFGSGANEADFILGVGKSEKRVIFLLDVGRVLNNQDLDGRALNVNEAKPRASSGGGGGGGGRGRY